MQERYQTAQYNRLLITQERKLKYHHSTKQQDSNARGSPIHEITPKKKVFLYVISYHVFLKNKKEPGGGKLN